MRYLQLLFAAIAVQFLWFSDLTCMMSGDGCDGKMLNYGARVHGGWYDGGYMVAFAFVNEVAILALGYAACRWRKEARQGKQSPVLDQKIER